MFTCAPPRNAKHLVCAASVYKFVVVPYMYICTYKHVGVYTNMGTVSRHQFIYHTAHRNSQVSANYEWICVESINDVWYYMV